MITERLTAYAINIANSSHAGNIYVPDSSKQQK